MVIDTSPSAVAEDWQWRIPRYWATLAKLHGVAVARRQYASETSLPWPDSYPKADADVGPYLANYPKHPQAKSLAAGDR